MVMTTEWTLPVFHHPLLSSSYSTFISPTQGHEPAIVFQHHLLLKNGGALLIS